MNIPEVQTLGLGQPRPPQAAVATQHRNAISQYYNGSSQIRWIESDYYLKKHMYNNMASGVEYNALMDALSIHSSQIDMSL